MNVCGFGKVLYKQWVMLYVNRILSVQRYRDLRTLVWSRLSRESSCLIKYVVIFIYCQGELQSTSDS
jgi:hypothetical protein